MPTCILKNSIITEASIILYTRWDPFSIVQAHEGRGAHSSLDRGGMRRVSVAIVMESLDRHRLVTVIGLAEVDRRGNVDSVIAWRSATASDNECVTVDEVLAVAASASVGAHQVGIFSLHRARLDQNNRQSINSILRWVTTLKHCPEHVQMSSVPLSLV